MDPRKYSTSPPDLKNKKCRKGTTVTSEPNVRSRQTTQPEPTSSRPAYQHNTCNVDSFVFSSSCSSSSSSRPSAVRLSIKHILDQPAKLKVSISQKLVSCLAICSDIPRTPAPPREEDAAVSFRGRQTVRQIYFCIHTYTHTHPHIHTHDGSESSTVRRRPGGQNCRAQHRLANPDRGADTESDTQAAWRTPATGQGTEGAVGRRGGRQ